MTTLFLLKKDFKKALSYLHYKFLENSLIFPFPNYANVLHNCINCITEGEKRKNGTFSMCLQVFALKDFLKKFFTPHEASFELNINHTFTI